MLVVFDVESTITENEFWDSFPQTGALTSLAMQGKADFRNTMDARFNAIKGITLSEFKEHGKTLKLRKGAKEFFQTLHENGFKTALVSGGFDFFTRNFARELGVKCWIANQAVLNGKKLTYKEPLVDALGKRKFVEDLAARFKLGKEEVIAVGDGANDIEMMKFSGFSIAFNAKPIVKQAASVCVDGKLADLLKVLLKQKRLNPQLI